MHCNLQRGITQPICQLFWHICTNLQIQKWSFPLPCYPHFSRICPMKNHRETYFHPPPSPKLPSSLQVCASRTPHQSPERSAEEVQRSSTKVSPRLRDSISWVHATQENLFCHLCSRGGWRRAPSLFSAEPLRGGDADTNMSDILVQIYPLPCRYYRGYQSAWTSKGIWEISKQCPKWW